MTGFTSGMRSSLTDQWATPQYLFDELDAEFGFTLDVCADESNHKVSNYYDKAADGLSQPWEGTCWMNPPYGRTIGDWVRKAYESSLGGGAIVVCLLPARTDTRWWRDYVMRASELRFISGRVRFGDAGQGAPFPSVIAIFGTPTTPRIRQVSYREEVSE